MKRLLILTAVCGLFTGCCGGFSVEVSNGLDVDRKDEIIEIPVSVLAENGIEDASRAVVKSKATGRQVASQLTWDGLLIFPAEVAANGKAEYTISEGEKEEYKARAYGAFFPERKDDLTWENDLISYRAYGPALEATGEVSCGYDVWVKRTNDMVVEHRYNLEFCEENMKKKKELKESGDEKAYKAFRQQISFHVDHGDGCDYYAVGRTLGCGAMAPYTEGNLWMANNFVTYEILDNGPLRYTCRLTYAPFEADGRMLTEERLITLDAGTHFNHATVKYTDVNNAENSNVQVAAGIILHGTEDYVMNQEEGYNYYADPVSKKDGQTYLGVIFPEGSWTSKIDCNHLLAVTEQTSEEGVSYYFGAGWSKFGFETPEDWGAHVAEEAALLKAPLAVSFR